MTIKLKKSSLIWARKFIRRFGDTDVLPEPFEFEAIEYDWVNVESYLAEQDVLTWAVRPARSLLAPKSALGFRVVTQLDPLDFLLYAALIYEIAPDIEKHRVPIYQQRVFSYRFEKRQDERFFNPHIGYRSFIAEAQKRIREEKARYVAVTDIADFYTRIYHHRLENALGIATTQNNHIKAIMRMLSGWNNSESYGIPIGNAPSRLLAEMAISDIDDALLAQGIDFIRFNDDYRLFTQTYTDAYCALAFLAEKLFRNHGLSLQPKKTEILSIHDFREKYLATPLDKELDSLHEKFEKILAELALADPYEPIDYDDIPPSVQAKIDALYLNKLLHEQIASEAELDIPLCRFVLRLLAQLRNPASAHEVLDNIERLYPVIADVVRYVTSLSDLLDTERSTVGSKLLDLLENSLLNSLEYYRIWALHMFAASSRWDCDKRFLALLNQFPDHFSRRKIILAMARSGEYRHWFQSQWRDAPNEAPWPGRALLAGFSCLPTDARKHLYKSMESRLDPLQRAVIRWARHKPLD
jgi:hypothetical protein